MALYNLPTADTEDLRSSRLKDYKNCRAIISSYVNKLQDVLLFRFCLLSSFLSCPHTILLLLSITSLFVLLSLAISMLLL